MMKLGSALLISVDYLLACVCLRSQGGAVRGSSPDLSHSPLTNQMCKVSAACPSPRSLDLLWGVDRKTTLMTSPNTHAHSALSNVYPDLSLSPYEPTGWDAGHGSAHSSTSETHRKRVACPLPPSHHRFGDFTVDMGHLSHGSGVSGVLVALLGPSLPPVAACLTQMTERTYFGSQFGRV